MVAAREEHVQWKPYHGLKFVRRGAQFSFVIYTFTLHTSVLLQFIYDNISTHNNSLCIKLTFTFGAFFTHMYNNIALHLQHLTD